MEIGKPDEALQDFEKKISIDP
jgi:tetratricopeptide (TPR) repeat protein